MACANEPFGVWLLLLDAPTTWTAIERGFRDESRRGKNGSEAGVLRNAGQRNNGRLRTCSIEAVDEGASANFPHLSTQANERFVQCCARCARQIAVHDPSEAA